MSSELFSNASLAFAVVPMLGGFFNPNFLSAIFKMLFSFQNATFEMFSKCKQNQLKKFIHVRISTEKVIGKKALKKFGFKKLPNKGTIVTERLDLKNNSLDTLVAFFSPAQPRIND